MIEWESDAYSDGEGVIEGGREEDERSVVEGLLQRVCGVLGIDGWKRTRNSVCKSDGNVEEGGPDRV